jgi:hypothetical protein
MTNTKYISLQVSQDADMSNYILEYILGAFYDNIEKGSTGDLTLF